MISIVLILLFILVCVYAPSGNKDSKTRSTSAQTQQFEIDTSHKTEEDTTRHNLETERRTVLAEESEEEAERKAADPVAPFCFDHEFGSKYEFIHEVRIVGVTFKNDRRSRQTILRQIYWRDPPYNKEDINITLKLTEFEDEPAVEVWTEEEQIGYLPKGLAPYMANHWDRVHSVFNFEVYGGGTDSGGARIPYGARLSIRLNLPTDKEQNAPIQEEHEQHIQEEPTCAVPDSTSRKMRKSKIEFITALIGSYDVANFINIFDGLDDGLTMLLVQRTMMPYVLCFTLATVFAWLAFFGTNKKSALTSAVLYIAAFATFPSASDAILLAVLAFIGYARIGSIIKKSQSGGN